MLKWRFIGRDVVFEVITGGGPYDLGKWMDKDPPRPIEHSTKSFEIISKSISKPIASKSIAKSTTLKTSSKPFAFPPLQQKTQPIESSKASKVAKTTGGTKPIRRNTIILGKWISYTPLLSMLTFFRQLR